MAGIYLHIPFCRKACHYCNFHFSTQTKFMPNMVLAMQQELTLRSTYLGNESIQSIYFGGGTPSLLATEQLHALLQTIRSLWVVDEHAEITLEANPDDFSIEKVIAWKTIGINRLSIGVQSFRDEDLLWMNRAHVAAQAENAIHMAQSNGIDNLTIDLIYGTPGLSDLDWEKNVQKLIELGVPHVSCYALTVEPKTALDHHIQTGKIAAPDPETQARHFLQLQEWLEQAGFDHYEISNFGKPGYYSKHNRSYWQGIPYLGIGPSAHSFDGKSRQWNIAHNAHYMQGIEQGIPIFEKEDLTQTQRWNEYVMTALRTQEGVRLDYLEAHFPADWIELFKKQIELYRERGQITAFQTHFVLTKKGKLFADGIAADLFQCD
jgi:oxygen-independent coproporphyrinogen III oxidase